MPSWSKRSRSLPAGLRSEGAAVILDARHTDLPLDRSVRLAIVGAGPAGMTLARELGDLTDVLLLEAGGAEADSTVTSLQEGETAGLPYPLAQTRARQFGGSSALWAGYCAAFDPHDFERRAWVPHSGWPFGIEALQPYFARSAELLNLGDLNFDALHIARQRGERFPFDGPALTPTVWRFGTPTVRFAERFWSEFAASSAITTVLNANVVDIRLDPEHCRVTELVIRTLEGREARVRADIVVLACGGIETARILLNSDSQVPQGVANSAGLIGRLFMEHPHLHLDNLTLVRPELFRCWSERGSYGDGRQFAFAVGLSPQVQAAERLLNGRAHVYRTPQMSADEVPRVGVFFEQAPANDSRVSLSSERDALGLRRTRLDWRLTDLDWDSCERTADLLGEEFAHIGAAVRRARPVRSTRDASRILYSNHHLGTTRMCADPEGGVVNENGRSHDLENLYITGGSVFPTVSWANPTFTVIALVLRLADHLRVVLAGSTRAQH